MIAAFVSPLDPKSKVVTEVTLAIETEIGARGSLFVEYAGDYPSHAGPSHLFNTGVGYRLTPTQQIDFHAAFGLNNAAPSYILGIGYSVRFDRLF